MLAFIQIWLVLSQVLMVAWIFRPLGCLDLYGWGESDPWYYRWFSIAVGVSAFMGFSLVLQIGYEHLLGFIPASWGFHESETEEWTQWRKYISMILAGGAAVPILVMLMNRQQKRLNQLKAKLEKQVNKSI